MLRIDGLFGLSVYRVVDLFVDGVWTLLRFTLVCVL